VEGPSISWVRGRDLFPGRVGGASTSWVSGRGFYFLGEWEGLLFPG